MSAREHGQLNTSEAFNYAELTAEEAGKVRSCADRIRRRIRTTMEGIIEIGMDLLKVKAVIPHGQFGAWLRAEFGWSVRSATNFMSVAEQFGPKSAMIAELRIQPTAAYLLAGPSVPQEARDAAIRRAEAGETITVAVAKDIVAETKPTGNEEPTAADYLGPRLSKVLWQYKRRWNPEDMESMVDLLREFLQSFESSNRADSFRR